MKKALAMALGAVLVAGSAAQADAATQVDFKGYYRVHYAVNGNLGYTSDENLNESFFEHRLNMDLTFQATDEVSVIWRFRAPAGRRFGYGPGDFSTRFVYGQVVQDWGTVRVGRLANGFINQFGLTTLGWTPALDTAATFIAPFESAGDTDGIYYTNTWDNGFGIAASYSKEKDGVNGTWNVGNGSDHDSDRFQIEPRFQWDGGGAALNMYYLRDASANPLPNDYGANDVTSAWYINPALMHSWGAFSAHFEGMFAFGETTRNDLAGNVDAEDYDAEGQGFYLDFDYNYGPGRVNLAGWWVSGNDVADQYDTDTRNNNDNNALADIVNGNFYPLVVAYSPINAYVGGLANGNSIDGRRGADGAVGVANAGLSFLSGQNTILSANFVHTYPGMFGTDAWTDNGDGGGVAGDGIMQPGEIDSHTNGVMDITDGGATPVTILSRNRGGINSNGQANHWALMLSGQHAFTDEITFNYALAYLALNNPNYSAIDRFTVEGGNQVGSIAYHDQDKDLGWEIDLGVNVQLLDNLLFTTTVGYMFTGDAYQQLKGYRLNGNATDFTAQAEWEDADDAYTWFNSLTFSF